ncbi:hypothetical protein HGB47_15340 [Leptospira yasudae]|uniref:hypothetical protein n=1 Tax=Leptospira yasudae TaxID=2202201 RepID=UPI001C4E35AF|nr:hypothetical protein [Leptospira yasudae]MBW0434990.1 hypothetical protein [Leptospira yasudae]
MYFLRAYKNQNIQHILSLVNFDGKTLCNEIKHSGENLQVLVEFEDMEDLIEFYPDEIKRKLICRRDTIALNSEIIESDLLCK